VPLNTADSFGFTVNDGLLITRAKSGVPALPAITVSDTVWLRVGPPATEPMMVTCEMPVGVAAPALIVIVIVAGLPETGEAELEG